MGNDERGMMRGGLAGADRLGFERVLQWLRLTFLLSPFLALAAFGPASLPYGLAIAAGVAFSYGLVEALLRRAPERLLRWQLWLRLLDVALVTAVLAAYHAFLGDFYFDSVYLLFVVAGAGTHGTRGAVLLSAAAGLGVLGTRLLLISGGAMPYETRHVTDAVFYFVFFLVVGDAVAFLMRRSAAAEAQREAAFREELGARNAALEEAAAARDVALREAQHALRSRDAFLAAASHDLKNPLTVILGTAQALARSASRGALPAERTAAGMGRIVEAAVRMQAQLDELVDASRAGSGAAPELRLEPVDLGALLGQIVAAHQAASEREIRLHANGTSAHPVVGQWDRVRLGRVLDNLLSNAVKYSPPGTVVDVTLGTDGGRRLEMTEDKGTAPPAERPNDGWAVVTVRDRGIGVPEEEQARVFEPFFRAGNVIDRVPGTGVGLAASRQIVEALGGAISLRSAPGEGTEVTVRLPVASRR